MAQTQKEQEKDPQGTEDQKELIFFPLGFKEGVFMNPRAAGKRSAVDLIVIFIFLNSLGFPGNYTRLLGDAFGTLVEYTAFALMIGAMLLTSADRFFDILILDLKKKYWAIYLFGAVLFISSMVVTIDAKLQIITCTRVSVTILFTLWLCNYFSIQAVLERVYYAQILFILNRWLASLCLITSSNRELTSLPDSSFHLWTTLIVRKFSLIQSRNLSPCDFYYRTTRDALILGS